jgi:ADP-ribose pyrophosphatase YjhB (NUDIX family)
MAIFTWHDGIVPDKMDIKQVSGLIFSRDGRLLLLVEKMDNTIKYSLAGGHPEIYDNGIEGTVRRELIEEVNITITKPIIVGYQEVDEEDGSPPFAQVRMTAFIDNIGEVRPDPDNGKTYDRILVSPIKAIQLLEWGEVGHAQVKAAMAIATNMFGITEFTDKEEHI